MSIKSIVSRTLKRLNLQGIVMKLPIFGQALYDGLSVEFDRVNDFRKLVLSAAVPNDNMSDDTIEDSEQKYGIDLDITATLDERRARVIEAAQRDGNGGPDWLNEQIQAAGFDLWVILNEKDVETFPQYGNFQYSQIQYGGQILYTDPRTIDGELVVSSPNGNVGPLVQNYGTFQYGVEQYGVLVPGFAVPRPRDFFITSDPDRWGYFFFLSPFPDRVAGPSELLSVTEPQFAYLKKLVIQLKHARNWAIVQVEVT